MKAPTDDSLETLERIHRRFINQRTPRPNAPTRALVLDHDGRIIWDSTKDTTNE
jgi:hypothetical protein